MIRSLACCALLLLTGIGAVSAADAPARLAPEQWCWTHDVPKSVCGACDRKLIPALMKNHDWCREHNRAESVCVLCDPSAKERLDAQRPATKPADAK